MKPNTHAANRLIPRRARLGTGLLAAIAVASLAACASFPPPVEQMAVSRAAVGQATTAGAPTLAPAEMALARDKLARAETAMTAKEHERALALAQQAQVDAQLAEAKAEAAKSRRAAEALTAASQALREELARQQNSTTPRN